MSRSSRSTDALKLHFPLQYVVAIVGMFLTVAGAMWTSTSQLRSDIRDILTRMEMQARVDEGRAKLQEDRAAALKDSIDSIKRRQELQAYEIQELKDTMTKGRIK